MTNCPVSKYLLAIGKKGGQSKSKKKAAASRRNGKLASKRDRKAMD
jgi:hypothetical protein